MGRHHTDISNGQNVMVRPSHTGSSFINCMYLSPSPKPITGDPMNSKNLMCICYELMPLKQERGRIFTQSHYWITLQTTFKPFPFPLILIFGGSFGPQRLGQPRIGRKVSSQFETRRGWTSDSETRPDVLPAVAPRPSTHS